MIPIIDKAIDFIDNVIDKIVPDAIEREKLKAEVRKEGYQWAQLDANDRDSARRRQVETRDNMTSILAGLYTGGYFLLLGGLMFGFVHPDPEHKGLLDVLMGVLTAGQYSIMAYYFGSSHSSSKKDSVIETVVRG
jgi:hypothetical protein